MALKWNHDERCKILDFILETSKCHNRPESEAWEYFTEFIFRPRRHSSFREAWIEFVEEKSSTDFEAQGGESTESVTTQIELVSKGDKGEDSEADKVVETVKGEEDAHMEDEEPSQTKETDATDLERFKETLKELEASSLEAEQQPDDRIFLSEGCSAILTKKPQQKRDDFKSDDLWKLEVVDMTLILANHNKIYPWGILKDVPVKVNDLVIPVDFVVLEEEIPLILGKPFLATIYAMINDQQKECVLRTDIKEEACLKEEDKEVDQEKLLVKIEMDRHDEEAMKTSNVRDENFYRGAEPQPKKILEQDLQQKEHPSNKAEEKAEIDKVIDIICALFATVELKRIWKQHPLFLKFMGFLTNKRKKTDDIFHLSYKTP
ncbi:hypothetical protein L195_g031467 [Trifolium pratense]|uniref:Uncharacterized protein n=1 Tax=Trifolium pratense TaxID=57577 RepID=A0A2K3LAG5_TRIPR|nr:hypothetical protein L195_g031467 [Trifolium pratense]